MDLQLENKIAFISASGRGIGRSVAKCLAREGVSVIVNGRTKSDLNNLLEELDDSSKHRMFCADLTEPNKVKELIDFFILSNMIPDIVVHNLGGNLNIKNPLCSAADWLKVQKINFEVPMEINRLIIPYMQEKKWGRICHTSSISALENQGIPPYFAA